MSDGQFSVVEADISNVLVIFGATGDLAVRMLLPSLYFLDSEGLLPEGLTILGVARSVVARSSFTDRVRQAVLARHDGGVLDPVAWDRFAARLDYEPLNATSAEELEALSRRIASRDGALVAAVIADGSRRRTAL